MERFGYVKNGKGVGGLRLSRRTPAYQDSRVDNARKPV